MLAYIYLSTVFLACLAIAFAVLVGPALSAMSIRSSQHSVLIFIALGLIAIIPIISMILIKMNNPLGMRICFGFSALISLLFLAGVVGQFYFLVMKSDPDITALGAIISLAFVVGHAALTKHFYILLN